MPDPQGVGWMTGVDGKLDFYWTTGDLFPQKLVDLLPEEPVSTLHL
jgi:hypothetical protein